MKGMIFRGLSFDTTNEMLKEEMSKFGTAQLALICVFKDSGHPKGKLDYARFFFLENSEKKKEPPSWARVRKNGARIWLSSILHVWGFSFWPFPTFFLLSGGSFSLSLLQVDFSPSLILLSIVFLQSTHLGSDYVTTRTRRDSSGVLQSLTSSS